jgi:mannose-6-phosphate isomerase
MWIARLAAVHPEDRMLIAPLLLRHVVLERGELLEVPPNTVHSYLSGTGVEVLTSSDNVVRAGLTQKHVALDEVARLLDTRAVAPRICPPPTQPSSDTEPSLAAYRLQHDGFQIGRVEVRPRDATQSLTAGSGQPRVLVCVRGELELRDPPRAVTVVLSAGAGALIPACVDRFEMTGDADAFLVEPGSPQ